MVIAAATILKTSPMFSESPQLQADDVLDADPRKPILYFRSFEKELRKSELASILLNHLSQIGSNKGVYFFSGVLIHPSAAQRMIRKRSYGTSRSIIDEQMIFADAFNAIGPYIALGRPTENFRDLDLGAAKKYVSNEEWQDRVLEWLGMCAAVVVEAADSKSLGWELHKIVEIVPPTRILLIAPHTDRDYSKFTAASAHHFPVKLPKQRPQSRLMIFDEKWRPIELENINKNVTETLEPFFEQIRPDGILG